MARAESVARGKSFLERVLEKIPEADRAAFTEKYATEDVLEVMGDGALKQDDYSRMAGAIQKREEEVNAFREELNGWQRGKQAEWAKKGEQLTKFEPYAVRLLPLIESGKLNPILDTIESGGNLDGLTAGDDSMTIPSDVVRKGDLTELLKAPAQQLLDQAYQQGTLVASVLVNLQGKHLHEFKEPLDTTALLDYARKNNQRVDQAYESFVSKSRQEVAAKAQEERDKKLREEGEAAGRKAALEEIGAQTDVGYPTDAPPTFAGHLNVALTKPDQRDSAQHGVSAAVRHFNELRTKQAAGAAK